MADEAFESLLSERADYPAIKPEGMNDNGLKWQLSTFYGGDDDKIQRSWQSLLAQPGWMLIHTAAGLLHGVAIDAARFVGLPSSAKQGVRHEFDHPQPAYP